jgi:anthranilate synthase component 2
MILLIDNYDSFTYNLVHYLGQLGAEVVVHRNDAISVDEAMALNPQAIVLSPGPCNPDKAGICLELVERAKESIPILGVCLGHQAIGQIFGGKIVRAPECMHGKVSPMEHDGTGVFANITSPFDATRYHSLTIEPNTMGDEILVNARTADGVIMGIRHKSLELHGVQFHPESIASEHGHLLLKNFLELANIPSRALEEFL